MSHHIYHMYVCICAYSCVNICCYYGSKNTRDTQSHTLHWRTTICHLPSIFTNKYICTCLKDIEWYACFECVCVADVLQLPGINCVRESGFACFGLVKIFLTCCCYLSHFQEIPAKIASYTIFWRALDGDTLILCMHIFMYIHIIKSLFEGRFIWKWRYGSDVEWLTICKVHKFQHIVHTYLQKYYLCLYKIIGSIFSQCFDYLRRRFH